MPDTDVVVIGSGIGGPGRGRATGPVRQVCHYLREPQRPRRGGP